MKQSISYVVTAFMLVFMMILTVSTINVFSMINKANAYHQTCIAEIQASNYSPNIINKYTSQTEPFKTTIIDRTVENYDTNLQKTGRIYEVKTDYSIRIPIINYKISKSITGYAR